MFGLCLVCRLPTSCDTPSARLQHEQSRHRRMVSRDLRNSNPKFFFNSQIPTQSCDGKPYKTRKVDNLYFLSLLLRGHQLDVPHMRKCECNLCLKMSPSSRNDIRAVCNFSKFDFLKIISQNFHGLYSELVSKQANKICLKGNKKASSNIGRV